MKNTLLQIVLISSAFFSASVHGMSCTVNNINSNVNIILQIVANFSETMIDIQVSGIDQLVADASLVGDMLYSQLVGIESQLEEFSSRLAIDPLCILISAPTTISVSGTYCVIQDIAGTITINASDVELDLNGHQVTMGIIVTAGQDTVSITNGTVLGGSPGIWVQSGCTNISITRVLVKNGTSGILFESVNGGLVEHCTLTSNITGLTLSNSNRITVFDTVATANMYAGFDLLSSSTNSFIECKALATGQNNAVSYNNEVAGFSSYNGYGNIFERCIANGTQALSTIDSDSIVAGFVLSGSESCSKIIGCESANANASSAGVTIPYGILLQERLSDVSTTTAIFFTAANIYAVEWSPDGQYIAVGGNQVNTVLQTNLQIFRFDRPSNTFTAVAGAFPYASTGGVRAISWSGDGLYLAVGGSNLTSGLGTDLQIFSFDTVNNTLIPVAGAFSMSSTVLGLSWSPNEQYVAMGGQSLSSGNLFQVFSFDRVTNAFTSVAGDLSAADMPSDSQVNSVDWSPDGNYIAVGGFHIAGGYVSGDVLQIYSFSQATNSLTPVAANVTSNGGIATVWAAKWHPHGQYVAISGGGFESGGLLQLFLFDRTNNALTPITSTLNGINAWTIAWSPDGNYIVVGGFDFGPANFQIFSFDAAGNFNPLYSYPTFLATVVWASSWSPDGQYISIGANSASLGNFEVFTGLSFPSQNVITDNTVYCNGHDVSATFTGATGVGISGSSIGNMITRNTAYNNPPISSNFFVPSNYYFVTNVFNPLFGQAPSALQNISLNANDPIVAPEDVGLLMQQILYNVTVPLPSQLDAIEAAVLTVVDQLFPCSPTAITTGTTITVAGNYCVINSLTSNGNIVINASDVNLDLNNRTVTGTITIAAAMSGVTISNGTINANGGASGILVNPGASDISISNVTVKNAITGIDFMSTYDATIQGCTLTQNTTGLQLNSSYNVQVSDTVASSNINAGFDLLSSFTNSFINCKALSTGQNNAVIYNNEVIGFSSYNGYGNIFEHCIANGTQAPLTTDSNSLVAGFVLRGTESCSKIIGCESANANASGSGVTIPYGILLQGSLSSVSGVTGTFSSSGSTGPYTCSWSPDGQYLAVGGGGLTSNGTNQLLIFSFNRINGSLTLLTGAVPNNTSGQQVRVSKWSPNGQFLAIGCVEVAIGSFWVQVYQFNAQNNSLQLVAQAIESSELTTGGALGIDWSPDGNFIAVGIITTITGNTTGLEVLQFNNVSYQLSFVAGSLISASTIQGFNASQWSPDGNYIVVSGTGNVSGNGNIQIFEFNGSAGTVTFVAGISTSGDGRSAIWSPDGNYIAYGTTFGNILYVYKFNRLTNHATLAQTVPASGQNWWNRWSPDGNYIATVGVDYTNNGGNQFQVWQFNRSLNTLTYITGAIRTVTNFIQSVDWSPDGTYMAVGGLGLTSGIGTDLQIFTGINFPSQNVIADNTVYCNGQDVSATFTGAVGVGISGTSICNMIIGNTAYNNPPTTSNFFVPSNYYFVTNVFNPLYGQAPTELQNISLNACDPIVAPVDVGLLAQQILYNVEVSIPSQLDVLLSAIESGGPCAPIVITSGTTIAAMGNYCVANSLNGTIVINTSDVYLDLNNRTITGSITIAATMFSVTISNGTINANGAASGILANPGASGITISNVTIKNAVTGIDFMSAYDATVQGCTLTQNTTGLQLNSSYNINVSDTIASSNVNAGFDLISSFTNSFINCKALSTGQNNTVIYNNEVVGFSSYNGYGNIFERCIANGTQAALTTDSNSLVAGFVLRGTEACSKIIGCESANASASIAGVTVPYGILLQGTLDETFNVAGALSSSRINSVDWSPDGQYVAIGGLYIANGYGTNNRFQILQFDRVTNTLTPVAGALSMGTLEINSVNWSPDGQYVAVGGDSIVDNSENQFQIFAFDRSNNNLMPVAGAVLSNVVFAVSWSPDGQYIAIGGYFIADEYPGNDQLQIFEFDKITNVLIPVAGALPYYDLYSIYTVNWSPDGQYVAIGGYEITAGYGTNNQFQIFEFNRSYNNLTPVAGALSLGGLLFEAVYSVDWSPDGQYVAIGGEAIADHSDKQFQIFAFDRSNYKLAPITGMISYDSAVLSVNWSPDGQYVAIGGEAITDNSENQFQIFAFDRSNHRLILVAGSLSYSDVVYSVDWSPDGQYVAIVGVDINENSGNQAQIFTGIQFPSQNVITDNTVYCNGHDVSATFTAAVGVGISGTSICNMIIGNTAYNNPPTTSNFFVPSNYYFVTNVFNPLFGQAPTELQNISLNACDPISAPVDVGLLAQQILYNVKVSIPSQLDVILAAVESSSPCVPTAITTGTTITAAGNYCVAESIMNSIVINSSDVNLYLNNRTVTGTITVAAAMSGVTISNGTINANGGASGILVNPGTSNISISNVTIKNATTGIDFMSAYDATVQGCTLTQNITGLQLNSSYNVQVSDTVASSNVNAGFDLISSFTNSFINCKALSTGQNNAVIYNNEVVGFSSYNGYGNIFERCIANGTQALSTTDSSSLIAGFALRGTESCSKIIGCESANAIASESGVTVPYGIFLQGTLDGTFNVTGALSYSTDQINTLDWSPDGQYLGVGGSTITNDGYQLTGYQLQIYAFDRVDNNLTPVAGALSSSDQVNSVNWSPDGQYVAIGGIGITDGYKNGGYQFQIFEFDRINNNLIPVAGALFGQVKSVNWSPDSQYVAIGGEAISGGYPGDNNFQIFQFDRVSNGLTPVAGTLNTMADNIFSVNWSPDGQYIAVGGESDTNSLQVFNFNRSTNVLTTAGGALGSDDVRSVSWSPDGYYIALGRSDFIIAGLNQLQIFSFNRTTGSLLLVAQALADIDFPVVVYSVNWSPDGQYVAVGGEDFSDGYQGVGYQFQIFEFYRSNNNLMPVAGSLSDIVDDQVQSVNWSPDGQYVAIGGIGITENFGNRFQIFTGIQFPSQNVITDNTVYCNGHDVSATFTGAVGVGISGTSICNMIIGNTVYNNPPTSSNFFEPSNYQFVTNVFNQAFGQGPTALQNIALIACQPIVAPVDAGLLALENQYLLQSIIAVLATKR